AIQVRRGRRSPRGRELDDVVRLSDGLRGSAVRQPFVLRRLDGEVAGFGSAGLAVLRIGLAVIRTIGRLPTLADIRQHRNLRDATRRLRKWLALVQGLVLRCAGVDREQNAGS